MIQFLVTAVIVVICLFLLAVLLCAAALSGTGTPGLYLGGLVWAFTDLCTLTPPPKDEVTAHDPA